MIVALRWPDRKLPANSQFLRLCKSSHKRKNWLFAGSLRSGQRNAAIMSLVQSAKLNDLNPLEYLKDVMDRLPTQPYSQIGELLPHNWKSAPASNEG